MILLRIALRGWWLVFLTASNVWQVSHGHLFGAFLGGFLISLTWWSNSHAAKTDQPGAAVAYGTGAALGTVSGMALTAWWYS